jgi:ATP-dependent helicase/nuclease subunit B
MLEGAIPRRRREDPVLFDQDREEIARLSGGRVRLPTSHDLSADERAHFIRLCSSPSQKLLLSYPLTSDDSDRVVTLYLDELRRATGLPLAPISHRVGDLAPPPLMCRGHEVRLAEALAVAPQTLPEINEWASEEGRSLAAHDPEAPLPLAALRDALECPFRLQAQHRLMWPGEKSGRVFRVVDPVAEAAGLIRAEYPDAAFRRASQLYDDYVARAYPHIEAWEAEVLNGAKDKLLQGWRDQCLGAAASLPVHVERRSATIEELGFSGTIKLGAVSARLTYRVAAAGATPFAKVYILPNLVVPDFASVIEGPQVDAFFLPLVALGLLKGRKAPVILEVTNQKAGFSRLMHREHVSAARMSRQSGSVPVSFPSVGPDGWSGMTDRLVEAGLVLAKASAIAKGGDHCRTCRYGELCRRSRDFGERVDPFDYESPPRHDGGQG